MKYGSKHLMRKVDAMRTEAQMREDVLCRLIGIEHQEYAKWKSGDGIPAEPCVLRIAEIFGVVSDDLLDLREKDLQNNKETRHKSTLVSMVRAMSDEDCVELMELIHTSGILQRSKEEDIG